MIYPGIDLVRSAAPRASFRLAEPPGVSRLLVPDDLVGHQPFPDADSDIVSMLCGASSTSSGDGLLLVSFMDLRATAPIVGMHGERSLIGCDMDPDIMRFVCNPLSGQLLRLPDIDGTKKTSDCQFCGLLTRSAHGHGPPDRYAVAELSEDRGVEKSSFVMRRFRSQTGQWEKLVGLPSPLPLARPLVIHDVSAFAGRLWWVDLNWGAVSADPLSDRPELRFVELPSASVLPAFSTKAERLAARVRGVRRRIGVSEGRLWYVELSEKKPFLLSSFVFDDDSSCWTLEHQVALGRLWAHGGHPSEEDIPRIGAVDPLNASIMHITIGTQVLAIDMNRGEVLGCSLVSEDETPLDLNAGFVPCVLPPWLGSSSIPRGPLKLKSKTLSDILVRGDKNKKN
ncbi:hypothetical protein BDA96_09G177500 [Sorghum bicolor]|uniref:DUF1618 domain-containing protein n=1 Tax=Sorghum bicolor TaxID=4558 RepID=A0A921QDS6_SORBI|nr:hypothetical protein BDA96_09G177500 [Sorghum bicolor]